MTDIIAGTIGAQRRHDVRGWLLFESLPDELQRAEDARLAAGKDLARHGPRSSFSRPASDTERLLLMHLGYRLPSDLLTRVEWLSPVVRQRRWPQLKPEGS